MELKELFDKTINYQPDKDILYFTCALAGETGEYCNLIKKLARDGKDKVDMAKIEYELADIIAYVILNARILGIDLERAIIEKNAIVKGRRF